MMVVLTALGDLCNDPIESKGEVKYFPDQLAFQFKCGSCSRHEVSFGMLSILKCFSFSDKKVAK